VRALANEEGVLDGPDQHCHVVGVGEIVWLYYHRILKMPYIITGVKATLEYSTMRSPFIRTVFDPRT
jgi:hypothetical protein